MRCFHGTASLDLAQCREQRGDAHLGHGQATDGSKILLDHPALALDRAGAQALLRPLGQQFRSHDRKGGRGLLLLRGALGAGDLGRVGASLHQRTQPVAFGARLRKRHDRILGDRDHARLAVVAVAIAPDLRASGANLDAQPVGIGDAVRVRTGLQPAQFGVGQHVSQPFVSQKVLNTPADSQPDSHPAGIQRDTLGRQERKTP